MTMLYRNPCYSEVCYNEVILYLKLANILVPPIWFLDSDIYAADHFVNYIF